jgi:hypothetical protein
LITLQRKLLRWASDNMPALKKATPANEWNKSSCNCTGCGMLRAGVCINCAETTAALILESGSEGLAVEPCSGACRRRLNCTSPPRQNAGARRSHDERGRRGVERRAKPLELGTELGVGDDSRLALALDCLGLPLQHPL